jgi:hypothetical protein
MIDSELILKVVSAILATVGGALIKHYLEGKPKLITYLVHASAIPLNDESTTQVNTHSIVVRNAGRKTANNIRIGHNWLPKSFQVFPKVSYEILGEINTSAEILIPTLVPNEQITISYLYFFPNTYTQVNSYTKSDEGMAKVVNAIPTPQAPKWAIAIVWILLITGLSTFFYFGLRLLLINIFIS